MVVLCALPIPSVIVVLIPSLLFRLLILFTVKIFRSDLTRVFSGKAVYLALESIYTRPKLNILVHFIYDGPITVEKLRHQFEHKITQSL